MGPEKIIEDVTNHTKQEIPVGHTAKKLLTISYKTVGTKLHVNTMQHLQNVSLYKGLSSNQAQYMYYFP